METITGTDVISDSVRQILVEGTYLRANSLTVVGCALDALLHDWDRMDEDTKHSFLEMARDRAHELVDVLKRDVAALEFTF